jgi:glycosyltransferase involved in cell wall biosynthesis
MYKGRKVAVVIPAFNVANQIGSVVKGIPDVVDEIVIVDDGSPDDLAGALWDLQDERVTIVRHAVNQGVGGAMVTGFRRALHGHADVVVKMDGDGQMDPAYLPALLDPIVGAGYGYAKGNRFLYPDELRDMPTIRLIGSFALTFLTKLASGYWHVFDPVNGFVAIDGQLLRRLPLAHIARRYFFEIDMLIMLNIFRARVKDVPVPARYGEETSSMPIGRVSFTFPLYLLRGFWRRLYQRHVLREFSPVAVFWLLGSLLLGWGTGFGVLTWIRSIQTGQVASTGTVMLSVLPFILGFQLALQAILIEIHDSLSWDRAISRPDE